MRVCIVTPYDLSHDGGVNRHVLGLAGALRALGHEACVLGPASGGAPEGCEIVGRAVPVPANGSVARIGLLAPPAATRERLARGAFDVVHVHEPLVPGPGRHALRHARVPVVATFHANDDRELPLFRALRAAAAGPLARVDFGIAVSRPAKAFSRAIYRGRTAVVPSGVDLASFASEASPPARAGPLGVLFVGRFGEARKGFPLLLDAVARLRAAGREVAVDVVGAGRADRPLRARRLGIRFHGRVCDAELAARYRAADVFCAPSLGRESFGMVLVEAMAAGCPVVASALPGYAEATRGAALVRRGRERAAALSWSRIAVQVLQVYRRAGAEAGALDPACALAEPSTPAALEGTA